MIAIIYEYKKKFFVPDLEGCQHNSMPQVLKLFVNAFDKPAFQQRAYTFND